jgi:PAS domain S-box-containing protein
MAKIQIMVVEDEKIVAEDIREILQGFGYEVPAIVSSGKNATEQAEKIRPDLVLMDIMLKGEMDGIVAAEEIRTRYDIPVIYLTAYADDKTLQRAKITEPLGYILKPFQERDLQIAIDMALYKHQMEQRLKEREAWLTAILKSTSDAIVTTDASSCITLLNPVAQAITRLSSEDAVGKKLIEVIPLRNTKTSVNIESLIAHVLQNGVVTELGDELKFAPPSKIISIEGQAAPIRNAKGDIRGMVWIFRDITKQKQAHEETRRMERLAILGKFASTVAHEIRNPLGSISLNFQFLESRLSIPENLRNTLKYIHQGMERIQKIIKEILDFTRPTPPAFRKENIHDVIANSLRSVEAEFQKDNITVVKKYEASPPTLFIDAAQIMQVFVNLLMNAKQAMSGGGKLTIATQSRPDCLIVQIEDTGKGIPKENQEKIFNLFFTTRADGVGLGLAIVSKILEQHIATISFESQIGVGTKFTIQFPLA